jgi:molecular chaperone GrpE
VTDDRRDAEPRFRVTDRRRFAEEAEGSEEPSARPAERSADDAVDARASEDAGLVAPGDEAAAANARADEYREHLQRLQAEFDNYRKRTLKEQSRMLELAAEPVIGRLLEVLDDFELALLHAEREPAAEGASSELERFVKGVELVFAKLVEALRAEGLERIEAEGKPFDPELHEALMQTGDGDGPPVVAEVFRPGYTLKGRVLRPAGVRVERS